MLSYVKFRRQSSSISKIQLSQDDHSIEQIFAISGNSFRDNLPNLQGKMLPFGFEPFKCLVSHIKRPSDWSLSPVLSIETRGNLICFLNQSLQMLLAVTFPSDWSTSLAINECSRNMLCALNANAGLRTAPLLSCTTPRNPLYHCYFTPRTNLIRPKRIPIGGTWIQLVNHKRFVWDLARSLQLES